MAVETSFTLFNIIYNTADCIITKLVEAELRIYGSVNYVIIGLTLLGAKPLPTPMLGCYRLNLWEHISQKL